MNKYFSIFIMKNGTLGFEMRNGDNTLYKRPAAVRGLYKKQPALNKIGLVVDKNTKEYKLFSNGNLVYVFKSDNFISLNDIMGLDTVYVGGVYRKNNISMGFDGSIGNIKIYPNAIEDKQARVITENNEIPKQIFTYDDNLHSNYYRIPTLITLKNGELLSSIDARKAGTHDARSNIDIGISKSYNNGESWDYKMYALHFDDYIDEVLYWPRDNQGKNIQINGSSSFIDSVLLQDSDTNRVFLFADAMPYGIGFNNAVRNSGFKMIDGRKYIKLRKNGNFDYSIRDNGTIYDDVNNKKTDYSVDENYNILYKGDPLFVKQSMVNISGNNVSENYTNFDVKMNIFYKDAIFKVERTNFLVYTYSDDNGNTFKPFKILEPFGNVNESVPLYGPGRGLQIKNGSYKGRLILSMYSSRTGEFGFMYSDDHGDNWKYIKADLGASGATAEAQIVEFSNGDLMTFYRTNMGKIGYVTSKDGGCSWNRPRYLENINVAKYGTQISAINYSKTIDGKDLIILSYPHAQNGRKNGRIDLGFADINDPEHVINWEYSYPIDDINQGFSYSGLTELQNGDIGLYYEKWDSWSRDELHLNNGLYFEKFSLDELYN